MAKNPAVRNLIKLINEDANNLKELYRTYGNIANSRFVCESNYLSADVNKLTILDIKEDRSYVITECLHTEDLDGSKNLLWIDEDDLYQMYRAGREWVSSMLSAGEAYAKYLRSKEKSPDQIAFEEAYL